MRRIRRTSVLVTACNRCGKAGGCEWMDGGGGKPSARGKSERRTSGRQERPRGRERYPGRRVDAALSSHEYRFVGFGARAACGVTRYYCGVGNVEWWVVWHKRARRPLAFRTWIGSGVRFGSGIVCGSKPTTLLVCGAKEDSRCVRYRYSTTRRQDFRCRRRGWSELLPALTLQTRRAC